MVACFYIVPVPKRTERAGNCLEWCRSDQPPHKVGHQFPQGLRAGSSHRPGAAMPQKQYAAVVSCGRETGALLAAPDLGRTRSQGAVRQRATDVRLPVVSPDKGTTSFTPSEPEANEIHSKSLFFYQSESRRGERAGEGGEVTFYGEPSPARLSGFRLSPLSQLPSRTHSL